MPHDMKKSFKLMVLVLAAMGMYSCNDEYQATPMISVSNAIIVSHQDGSRDTTYFGDTIQVGDTARVDMCIMGVSHPLKTAQATSEPTALACGFECDSLIIKEFLEEDSKPEEGYLHFQPLTMYVWVTFRYIAKSAGTYPIKVEEESMAKEPYSHNEQSFYQIIR